MNLKVMQNNALTFSVIPLFGGGQAGAGQLNPGVNSIQDVDSPFDSVQLPNAVAGTVVIGTVQFFQSSFMGVFAKEGTDDSINGEPNNQMFVFPTVGIPFWTLMCVCGEDGLWSCNILDAPLGP
jgi:hypothetical protein